MIKFSFRRPSNIARLGEVYVQKLKDLILRDLDAGLRAMQDSLLQTPVYTGRTLVNYRWSLGEPVTGVRAPVADPSLPGTTSTLPLGAEPRRRANAAVVREEFEAVLTHLRTSRNPFVDIYLTNSTPYFDQVEYGTYSTSAGHGVRTPPGGMVRRGETILEAAVFGLSRGGEGV